MKERKKQIYLQCLVLAVMMRCQYPIYADTVFPDTIYNTYEKPDYFRGAVSIEDVLEWNKEYLLGNEREETYYDFFSERSVPMIMTVSYDDYAPYAVMDEYRQYAYKISPFPPLSSSSAKKGIYLYSCITGNYISLVLSEEEVQGFIETEEKVKREIREKKAYVL